ncbi:Bug family tripartite tricarboxylate transporter substrate binding protein [Pseudorhodoferax sp.]|uniref:Bug family tripartite tricarboxylate transporter substrate binding protein n=1 Tax=Pseudorhodoferax sp. TaxID=1993553 RepID=UPI002DD61DD4|nr:tripartite tricarboxylate transporter substrate binding protein [Pseudorhodoferax sp.]
MTLQRRALLRAAAALPAAGLFAPHAMAAWPSRPIRIVVPYPAGGGADLYARRYAEFLAQALGQPVIVDNRPGATGTLGSAEVARAAPDGHTLLFTNQTAVVQSQALVAKMPFDPNTELTRVAALFNGNLPLAVSANAPFERVEALIERARKEPVSFGTYGAGSIAHMLAYQLNKAAGTQFNVVHYKGENPMWVDVAGGHVQCAVGSYPGMLPHLQKGSVRPLAVTTRHRSPQMPDVRTFAEIGYEQPVFTMQGYMGIFAPARLPSEVLARLSEAIQEGAKTAPIRAMHASFGGREVMPATPAEFEQLWRAQTPVWVALARELDVRVD